MHDIQIIISFYFFLIGLGLDNLETKILPSFHYDGSDNGNIKHTEADVDDLLETQELNYGDFFEDHPTHSDRALTKKLTIRSVERVRKCCIPKIFNTQIIFF